MLQIINFADVMFVWQQISSMILNIFHCISFNEKILEQTDHLLSINCGASNNIAHNEHVYSSSLWIWILRQIREVNGMPAVPIWLLR